MYRNRDHSNKLTKSSDQEIFNALTSVPTAEVTSGKTQVIKSKLKVSFSAHVTLYVMWMRIQEKMKMNEPEGKIRKSRIPGSG